MDILEILNWLLGAGGVGTIAVAIINKSRNKGEKISDNDSHLRQLSEIMSETIKNVQEINKETINNLKSELLQSQELIKLSHQREDSLVELINKGRENEEELKAGSKYKTKIIQKARKCDLLQGKPLEDCIVLNAYEEYSECKEQCKLKKEENK